MQYKLFKNQDIQRDKNIYQQVCDLLLALDVDQSQYHLQEPELDEFPDTPMFYLAFDNDKVVGVISFWYELRTSVGFIDEFFVCPDYRGQGVGSKLLDLCLKEIKKYNNVVELMVYRANSVTRKLYSKKGFKVEFSLAEGYSRLLNSPISFTFTPPNPGDSESTIGYLNGPTIQHRIQYMPEGKSIFIWDVDKVLMDRSISAEDYLGALTNMPVLLGKRVSWHCPGIRSDIDRSLVRWGFLAARMWLIKRL